MASKVATNVVQYSPDSIYNSEFPEILGPISMWVFFVFLEDPLYIYAPSHGPLCNTTGQAGIRGMPCRFYGLHLALGLKYVWGLWTYPLKNYLTFIATMDYWGYAWGYNIKVEPWPWFGSSVSEMHYALDSCLKYLSEFYSLLSKLLALNSRCVEMQWTLNFMVWFGCFAICKTFLLLPQSTRGCQTEL